jgi:hypothetical protein
MPKINATVLGPKLRQAKETLRSALDEACRADLERANTGELIRIEEVLAIANEAAKEAVSVRRRLSAEHAAADAPPQRTSSAREMVDERGVRWAVFAVIPSTSDSRPTVRERFRAGWLSFDSGHETRRLVPIPRGWQELPEAELRALLLQAEVSPRRTHTTQSPPSEDSESSESSSAS